MTPGESGGYRIPDRTVLCRQCWERDSIAGMLVCSRCADKNNPADPIAEGKAVRRGEDRKADEEEMFHGKHGGENQQEVERAAVGGSQGKGQA